VLSILDRNRPAIRSAANRGVDQAQSAQADGEARVSATQARIADQDCNTI
jgi:hypothetical protein